MKPSDRGVMFLVLVLLLAVLVSCAQLYDCERQAGAMLHRFDITHGCQVMDGDKWLSLDEWKGRHGK